MYDIVRGDMDFFREVNVVNVGNFLALKNGTVKCRFFNRMVVSFIYPPPCDINIMDPQG